ncbi:hypothetical protein EVAR_26829_1 [Eumeta japonica]|uniref:Uncharacterized protein n=1 Tax=Eumeta variegata TaxID=151549 RepID=A0A4C1VZA4_EUMVA|nr:hypothetical protein EVAR_26829_1 [Eumeta japonica]
MTDCELIACLWFRTLEIQCEHFGLKITIMGRGTPAGRDAHQNVIHNLHYNFDRIISVVHLMKCLIKSLELICLELIEKQLLQPSCYKPAIDSDAENGMSTSSNSSRSVGVGRRLT